MSTHCHGIRDLPNDTLFSVMKRAATARTRGVCVEWRALVDATGMLHVVLSLVERLQIAPCNDTYDDILGAMEILTGRIQKDVGKASDYSEDPEYSCVAKMEQYASYGEVMVDTDRAARRHCSRLRSEVDDNIGKMTSYKIDCRAYLRRYRECLSYLRRCTRSFK